MKRRLIIGLVNLLIIPATSAKSLHPITYFEAVRIAITNNPALKSNKTNIEAAKATIIEKRGAALPKLNLEFNAARSNNPLNVFAYRLSQGNVSFADFGFAQFTGPGSLYTMPSALNQPGYYSNLDTAFNLLVPLYSGGEKTARLREAKDLLEAAYHGNKAAQNKLAYDILVAYEGVLAAQAVIKVTQQGVEAATRFLELTRRLKQQSLVLENDVLLAESYLLSSQTSVEAARMEWQNHVDEFRTLIGMPESNLVPAKEVYFAEKKPTIASLINTAIANNPNLREMKSERKASAANLKAVRSANLPHINLQLRHDWNGENLGSGYPSNLIGLQLNWLLFSGGERSGVEQKAVAHFKQIGYQIDDTTNQIKTSINQAIRADKLAHLQYETYQTNAARARKGVEILVERYGRGLVPLGQLLEAQMQLNDARHQFILSGYNKKIARGHVLLLTNNLVKPQIPPAECKLLAFNNAGVMAREQ